MPTILPPVTHLQVLVLEAVTDAEQCGRELRDRLAAHGIQNSTPAFYQMMGRLEESGLVEGWYQQELVAGQNVKQRRYHVTRKGLRALAETRAFYRSRPFMVDAKRRHA